MSDAGMGRAGPLAVILATTAPSRGGVWRHIADLAGELRSRGHAVTVAVSDPRGELAGAARTLELPIVGLAASVGARGTIWHGHLHDSYDRRFLLAVAARRAIGPSVLTEHLPRTNASDPSLLPGPRRRLAGPAKTAFKRLELALADAVIAVSPSSAEFLRRRYGDHGRLFVVANGLEPAAVATRPAHDGPVRVVSLGSVIEQKGHELLVEAAALRRKGWQATVLGEGPRREALASAARRRGLPVGFPGPSPDIASALAAADIACLPSRWESAPYAALEAMQAGLPLVATDVDGLRDLVQDGVNGLLVTPDSPGALAAALDRVAGDASLRERLGAAARRRAAEFTRARMADETLAVYRAALAWRSSR